MSASKKPSLKNLVNAPKEVVAPPKKVNYKAVSERFAANLLATYGKTPANFKALLAKAKANSNARTKKSVAAKKGRSTRRSKK